MSGMTNSFGNSVLASLATNQWIGLHTSDPTSAGLGSTEMSGGSYARQAVTWTTPSNRTIGNTNVLTFVNLPAGTVTHFVVWSTSTAGTAQFIITLVTPVVVAVGGTFTIPVSDLTIQLN